MSAKLSHKKTRFILVEARTLVSTSIFGDDKNLSMRQPSPAFDFDSSVRCVTARLNLDLFPRREVGPSEKKFAIRNRNSQLLAGCGADDLAEGGAADVSIDRLRAGELRVIETLKASRRTLDDNS